MLLLRRTAFPLYTDIQLGTTRTHSKLVFPRDILHMNWWTLGSQPRAHVSVTCTVKKPELWGLIQQLRFNALPPIDCLYVFVCMYTNIQKKALDWSAGIQLPKKYKERLRTKRRSSPCIFQVVVSLSIWSFLIIGEGGGGKGAPYWHYL
jgi:hypothetical protein